jgi:hypothetical protein
MMEEVEEVEEVVEVEVNSQCLEVEEAVEVVVEDDSQCWVEVAEEVANHLMMAEVANLLKLNWKFLCY